MLASVRIADNYQSIVSQSVHATMTTMHTATFSRSVCPSLYLSVCLCTGVSVCVQHALQVSASLIPLPWQREAGCCTHGRLVGHLCRPHDSAPGSADQTRCVLVVTRPTLFEFSSQSPLLQTPSPIFWSGGGGGKQSGFYCVLFFNPPRRCEVWLHRGQSSSTVNGHPLPSLPASTNDIPVYVVMSCRVVCGLPRTLVHGEIPLTN